MWMIKEFINYWLVDFLKFTRSFLGYVFSRFLSPSFYRFEAAKGLAVVAMYQQRGKYAQVIVQASLLLVVLLGVTLGPSLVVDNGQIQMALTQAGTARIVFAAGEADEAQVLGVQNTQVDIQPMTQVSDKPPSETRKYTIQQGDTLSTIASTFGVTTDTIKWANPDKIETEKTKLKVGDSLDIPPVSGVIHTVKSGETVYSIAKKYSIDAQGVVDYPYNTFTNDETFALAIGQQIVVPEGIMPDIQPISPKTSPLARILTPDAGSVSATGRWSWPAAGRITQGYLPWHKALDIANSVGGSIVAADSGVVMVASWLDNTGYGNRVLIDHGNGYKTLYGHLSKFSVVVGQRVNRGDKIGEMGSTGRSTGPHLHFEIRGSKGNLAPLEFLK